MAKLHCPVRLKEPSSGEFQHKSRRFSLSALEDLGMSFPAVSTEPELWTGVAHLMFTFEH